MASDGGRSSRAGGSSQPTRVPAQRAGIPIYFGSLPPGPGGKRVLSEHSVPRVWRHLHGPVENGRSCQIWQARTSRRVRMFARGARTSMRARPMDGDES